MRKRKNDKILKSNLSKAEFDERKSYIFYQEELKAPEYLNENLKEKFYEIAKKLINKKMVLGLDNLEIARLVVAEYEYFRLFKEIQKHTRHTKRYFNLIKAQDRSFKQARTSAKELGLTIASRVDLNLEHAEFTLI